MTLFNSFARTPAPPPPDLPAFPAAAGPAVARQVEVHVDTYADRARRLRAELRLVEDAMIDALDAQDRRAATRERLRDLAAKGRKR